MKNIKYISAVLGVVLAMISPVHADVIADQSRISVASPFVPGLDTVNFPVMTGFRP